MLNLLTIISICFLSMQRSWFDLLIQQHPCQNSSLSERNSDFFSFIFCLLWFWSNPNQFNYIVTKINKSLPNIDEVIQDLYKCNQSLRTQSLCSIGAQQSFGKLVAIFQPYNSAIISTTVQDKNFCPRLKCTYLHMKWIKMTS